MMDFLLGVILLPIIATLLMPRRWLTPWGLFIALAVFVLFIDEGRARGGAGATLGMGLLLSEVFIISVIFVSRFSWASYKQDTTVSAQENLGSAAATWALLAAGSAVALTALWVQGWNFVLDSGLATHLAVFAFAIAWFVATPIGWTSRPSPRVVLTLHPSNVFRLVGTMAVGVTLVWSIKVNPAIVKAAQAQANGQSFCLLVPGVDGLRPAGSYFDLTGFVMQAGRGGVRHAQMAVGDVRSPQWFYWSYRQGAFVPDVMGGVLSCDLQLDFATGLSWFSNVHPADDDLKFWLGGGQWRIPREFYGSSSDAPPRLKFHAQGKAFAPPTGALVRSGPQSWDQIQQSVDVLLCVPQKLHVWHTENDPNFRVESIGKLHGLDKQRVQNIQGGKPHFQYIEYDPAGRARTWLECESDWSDCPHAFERDGIVVSFRQSGQDFGEWRSVQDAVWSRVKSFSISWPDRPPSACVR